MGTKSKQEHDDDDGSPSNLSAESTKFFKILLNPELDDKLKMPAGLIKKYRGNLPDKVALKAPNGTVRQVELVQLGGETWLYNGWEEFRDYYSIRHGYLLVFEYDGKSQFNVSIYDTSTLEIEYPRDDVCEDEGDQVPVGTEVNESESDDSDEMLKQAHTIPRGKRKRNDGQDKRRAGKRPLKAKKTMTMIKDKEKCAAYQRAKAFKSNNPFCICIMQPSYVSFKTTLFVPLHFASENLPRKKNKLRLRVKAKGTWNVTCSFSSGRDPPMTGGWKEFVNDNGLKVGDVCVFEVNKRENFLWDVTIFREPKPVVNELETNDSSIDHPLHDASEDEGDEVPEIDLNESKSDDCASVILKEVRTALKRKQKRKYGKAVDKSRGTEGQLSKKKRTTISITDNETYVAYRSAKAFESKNPFCISLIYPSFVTYGYATIPVAFARKHLPEQRNKLRLHIQKKGTWTVGCYVLQHEARMISGWAKFVKENDLKVGDACVFEVNKFKKLLWNVTIFREPKRVVNELESADSATILKDACTSLKIKRKDYCEEECNNMRRIMDWESCRTYKKAKACAFDNPICIRIMQPSYVTPGNHLGIPLSFAKECLPAERNELKLQVEDVTWTVTCVLFSTSAQLISGWRLFVKDNALKVGDTCVFEVNKRKRCLWNVTIFRS